MDAVVPEEQKRKYFGYYLLVNGPVDRIAASGHEDYQEQKEKKAEQLRVLW